MQRCLWILMAMLERKRNLGKEKTFPNFHHFLCTLPAQPAQTTSASPLRRRAQGFEPSLTACVTKKEHFYFSGGLTETQSTGFGSDTASLQISATNGKSKESLKGLGDFLNPPLCSKPRSSMPLLFPALTNISCLLFLEDPVFKASN